MSELKEVASAIRRELEAEAISCNQVNVKAARRTVDVRVKDPELAVLDLKAMAEEFQTTAIRVKVYAAQNVENVLLAVWTSPAREAMRRAERNANGSFVDGTYGVAKLISESAGAGYTLQLANPDCTITEKYVLSPGEAAMQIGLQMQRFGWHRKGRFEPDTVTPMLITEGCDKRTGEPVASK